MLLTLHTLLALSSREVGDIYIVYTSNTKFRTDGPRPPAPAQNYISLTRALAIWVVASFQCFQLGARRGLRLLAFQLRVPCGKALILLPQSLDCCHQLFRLHQAFGLVHLHRRRVEPLPTAPRTLHLHPRRADLQVLPQVSAQHLGATVIVWTRHRDAWALTREVDGHVAALAHPKAPVASELAEALQIGDQPLGETVGHCVARHVCAALRAL